MDAKGRREWTFLQEDVGAESSRGVRCQVEGFGVVGPDT